MAPKFDSDNRMQRSGRSTFEPEPAFDPDQGVYRLQCDWDAVEGPALVVVEAVAAVHRCDTLELEPLQDVVDVDGLEAVLRKQTGDGDFKVEFEYADTIVELSRSGDVVIEVL